MKNTFSELYDKFILGRARTALFLFVLVSMALTFFAQDFRIDASSDSLTLEHDADLKYYREVSERFENSEFVFIAYKPAEDLFSDASLLRLKYLREELRAIPSVESVVSLLDVPLLKNPLGPLSELSDNIKSLDSGQASIELARKELQDSPIYQNLLISPSMQSTALQINFSPNLDHQAVLAKRSTLKAKQRTPGGLTDKEAVQLAALELEHRRMKEKNDLQRSLDVAAIRKIVDKYRAEAQLYLGGVPMVVDDILSFIRGDLAYFGIGLVLFLILTLSVVFRKTRWVILPLICCSLSALVMVGLLGLLHWDITVVSSNFISLQLIFTMSLAIHIIVRYREFLRKNPATENRELILSAVKATFIPCLYASMTTIAGFTSLVISDILPVVNFGWMMTMGLVVSFIVTFTLLPAALMIMKKPDASAESEFGLPLTSAFARLTENRGALIFTTSALILITTGFGVTRLTVENSFIDYFKKSTDIYQGMKFIDDELGGTTPLDIMLTFPSAEVAEATDVEDLESDDDFSEFSEFEEESAEDSQKYWFTQDKMATINKVHDYLDSLPATGKVLSLATLERTATELNNNEPFDNFTLAILFGQMQGEFRKLLIDPYVSVEKNQTRLSTRIRDSLKGLRRDDLIQKVKTDIVEKFDWKPENIRVTGLMVLYNNMLQSLFDSQIKTIGYTVTALFFMFLLLFRSLKIAVIAISPSLLSSLGILGLMGLLGIPLDLMTITIVAISVGIAVDDTIHYLHRFKDELQSDGDYIQAMHRSHRSIGSAMYYTSLTITMGFSILALSNFIPTILFGLFTALAMLVALVASLSLLPRLIILLKPFG